MMTGFLLASIQPLQAQQEKLKSVKAKTRTPSELVREQPAVKTKPYTTETTVLTNSEILRAIVVAGDTALPLQVSNSYKRLMKRLQGQLKADFLLNASGELPYYADSTHTTDCWFFDDTRFKNKREELDGFIELMRSLDVMFKKRELTDDDRRRILQLSKDIAWQRSKVIRPVDAAGEPVRMCNMKFMSGNLPLQVSVALVSSVTGAPLSGYVVYAVRQNIAATCNCDACFFNEYDACDINAIKQIQNASTVVSSTTELSKGYYHLLVVQPGNGVERVVYAKKYRFTRNGQVTVRVPLSN